MCPDMGIIEILHWSQIFTISCISYSVSGYNTAIGETPEKWLYLSLEKTWISS